MRRVRYASTNDIRYTGYGRRSSGSSGGGVSALRVSCLLYTSDAADE